jgi:hypothetical protein
MLRHDAFPRAPSPPAPALLALRRLGLRSSRFLLTVSVAAQRMRLFEKARLQWGFGRTPRYEFRRQFLASTSAFGTGQRLNSNQTPLGLHRVARKVGAGHPIGTVFRGRQAVALTWQGQPEAVIVHRIFWLEGLEPGFNRGGEVDSFRRYIYIHGFGDETTLGRPVSLGCLHLAAADLLPLFDLLPIGTFVWIGRT